MHDVVEVAEKEKGVVRGEGGVSRLRRPVAGHRRASVYSPVSVVRLRGRDVVEIGCQSSGAVTKIRRRR